MPRAQVCTQFEDCECEYDAANPTKAMKDEWQRETKARYGLTPEQLADVEAQLEELAASMQRSSGTAAGSPTKGHVPLSDLIGATRATITEEPRRAHPEF